MDDEQNAGPSDDPTVTVEELADLRPAEELLRPDFRLASLQDLANNAGIEAPITVSVGGQLVTRQITSGRPFFEAQADLIERGETVASNAPDV